MRRTIEEKMERRQKGIRACVCLLALGGMFLALGATRLGAEGDDVKIKILALNPSETEPMKTTVTHELPAEVMPEDVLDKSGMNLSYNQDSRSYILSKQIELQPKESRTIEVRVRNVWRVPVDIIDGIRQEYDRGLSALRGTKHFKMGEKLYEKNMGVITSVEESQDKPLGIRQRIELYRANMKRLEIIRNEILSIQALRQVEAEDANGVRTAKFVFTAQNPASTAKKMTVRATLPEDITADDVIDKLDFTLLFDKDAKRFAVEKSEKLETQEKKKYEIILRDIWYIPQSDLDFFKAQTAKLLEHFQGTQYNDFAAQSVGYIDELVQAIVDLQETVQTSEVIEDRIRANVLNRQRIELIRKRISDLQDLLLELPIKKSAVDQIRSAVKKMRRVVDILRLGFQPDLSTTWWIILGIIAFIAMFSTVFYVTWLTKLNAKTFGSRRRTGAGRVSAPPATPSQPATGKAPPKQAA